MTLSSLYSRTIRLTFITLVLVLDLELDLLLDKEL